MKLASLLRLAAIATIVTTPFAAVAIGCSDPPSTALTIEQLKDPKQCQTCHPDHYREWSSSMHAYAAADPIFLAMNARGQRETNGALGDFCVKCHAPLAVRDGSTKDGLNLASLGESEKGITCFFCHSVDAVTGTHDNPLVLANDSVLRAGIADPFATSAHASSYSKLHDRAQKDSSSMCGSCHDIVTPGGAHLERTFAEWQDTIFAKDPQLGLSCSECHMSGRDGTAAKVDGAPTRRLHAHTFEGVDTAIVDFPGIEEQKALVQKSLDTTLQAALCVKGATSGTASIQVVLDNVGAGHSWPSGSTQDRRAYAEVIAYAKNKVVYASGVVKDGDAVLAKPDADLWLLRDCMFDDKKALVHDFWQAASYEGNALPGPVTANASDPSYYLTHVVQTYPRAMTTTLTDTIDRVTLRVRLEPIGLEVLDELVAKGDLDPKHRAALAARVVDIAGAAIEWKPELATIKYPEDGLEVACVTKGLATGANAGQPAKAKSNCSP